MSFFNIVAATNEDTVVATYEPSKVRSDSYQSEAELEKELIRLLCEQGYTYLPLHTEDGWKHAKVSSPLRHWGIPIRRAGRLCSVVQSGGRSVSPEE